MNGQPLMDVLNDRQREAVSCTEGPLLVLAGAGSGKTRVLTYRIAYLIEEKRVNPWNILAITFTNKAAGEMKERVMKTVREGAASVWVSTFHSSCVRILRRFGEYLGYGNNFSIYDADDQKIIMKQVIKRLDVDPKIYKERTMLNYISEAKDKLITPEAYAKDAVEIREKKIALIYQTYQDDLMRNNAMDFDDLIMKTVELFMRFPEILDRYQERFRYIMVDEYQDTNHAQFKLVELLAAKYKNLCVVGDDDQSIYKFRGADVRNILEFETAFPGAQVVKLEQNYRSTGSILTAANEVIRNNRSRKKKTLWTANPDGALPKYYQFETGEMEAESIARMLQEKKEGGRDWKDMAVLYRTNAQSRLLEEACIRKNIPYLLVGGVNFYQRKEIKDILAYLKTIANGVDDLAVNRIINVPKRGIGLVTVGKMMNYAADHGLHLFDVVGIADKVPGIGKAAQKIAVFSGQMDHLRELANDPTRTIAQLIEAVLKDTGYEEELKDEGEDEAKERLSNIHELISKAVSYEKEAEHPTLAEFLELVALVADVDRMDDKNSRVTLMTLHSAKGLEFPVVVMAGMEEGLFPSMMSISSVDQQEMEEERRLCYVGITRAREELVLTGARLRMVNGETRFALISQFIHEIPEDFIEKSKLERAEPRWASSSSLEDGNSLVDDSALPWGMPAKKKAVSSFEPGKNPYASSSALSEKRTMGSSTGGSTGTGSSTGGGAGTESGAAGFGKTFSVVRAAQLDYQEGDRVLHTRFGAGTVEQIVDGAKDYEVTVNFDRTGVKKMFASFAKLQKIENP